MIQYIAIPSEEYQGCEGCCFDKFNSYENGVMFLTCTRPDSVPHCQQTDEQGNVKEFIYEVKP